MYSVEMQNFVSLQFYNYGNTQSQGFYTFHKSRKHKTERKAFCNIK